jgi:hypothetical protein
MAIIVNGVPVPPSDGAIGWCCKYLELVLDDNHGLFCLISSYFGLIQ